MGARTYTALSEHFNEREFACPHCGEVKVEPALVDALEEFRRRAGNLPVIVTSGYRCPEHNRAVGGKPHSYHLAGKAADVKVRGLDVLRLYRAAVDVLSFKQGGIGLYSEGFVHLDIGPRRRWGRIDGVYVPFHRILLWLDEAPGQM